MSDVCFICSKPAVSEIVVVKRGLNTIINSSVERNDGYVDYLKDKESVTVHKECRKVYTKRTSIAAATKASRQRAIECGAAASKSQDNIKEECSLLCWTCLSKGRILLPLGAHKHIFQRLFNTDEIVDMCICWECHAILNKVAKFVTKANQAQNILLNNVERDKSLSSLGIKINELNEIHIKQEEDSMVIKNEIDNCAEIENETNRVSSYFPDDFDYTNQEELSSDDFPEIKFDIKEIKSDNTNNVSKTVTKAVNHKNKKVLALDKTVKEKRKRIKKYILNESHLNDYTESYRIIYLKPNQLSYWFERDRTDCLYVQNEFKCENCILSWPREKQLTEHIKRYHSNVQNSAHICDVCSCNFQNKSSLLMHMRIHFYVYACKMCNNQFHKPKQMYNHFQLKHYNLILCTKCQLSFGRYKDFKDHYKGMHMSFQCDYCQKIHTKKKSLAKHVSMRHLSKCPQCNLVVKGYKRLTYHIDSKHKIVKDETTFCVECNKQFDTVGKFKMHVGYSQFHRKQKGIPISLHTCPICKKEYKSRAYMFDHMDFVHAKRSKYYCKECDKYFPKKDNLQIHQRHHHEGLKPIKNKFCHFCGRGFAVNKTLINHIRTHTGERPYQCSYCPNKFAQKVARNYHEKNVHLKATARTTAQRLELTPP